VKLGIMHQDKEFIENEAGRFNEEEEKHIEDTIALREDIADDETKELEGKKIRLKYIGDLITDNDYWK